MLMNEEELSILQGKRSLTRRSFLIASAGTACLVGLGVYIIFHTANHVVNAYLCQNTIISREAQPSGRYELVYFERGCGSAAASSFEVAVVPRGSKLANQPGNIFIAEQPLQVRWLNSAEVLVNGGRNSEYRKIRRYRGIHIHYDEQ
jgi:hypothetical protein